MCVWWYVESNREVIRENSIRGICNVVLYFELEAINKASF